MNTFDAYDAMVQRAIYSEMAYDMMAAARQWRAAERLASAYQRETGSDIRVPSPFVVTDPATWWAAPEGFEWREYDVEGGEWHFYGPDGSDLTDAYYTPRVAE